MVGIEAGAGRRVRKITLAYMADSIHYLSQKLIHNSVIFQLF